MLWPCPDRDAWLRLTRCCNAAASFFSAGCACDPNTQTQAQLFYGWSVQQLQAGAGCCCTSPVYCSVCLVRGSCMAHLHQGC